ncbi:MAG: tRNA lysidine(34) synthetase TilS [Prevotellaceae bacterium]|jgi:tRNA(Ile)-lysidine synthase|nr:tRNA lysidine(34) synthetase TilS [Prevotellaceae bacterium]
MSVSLKNVNSEKKYLIAVSGGVDSMVMANLFAVEKYDCAIAHCNFSLRGEESDGDEKLVADFAEKYKIPLYTVRFDTENYAEQHGLSIQVAARELRYEWFEKTRMLHGFDKIAVAHNSDDNIETFFINFMRGAGLNGLTGIPQNSAYIVRPLIDFSRDEIMTYATVNNVKYREDSSNLSLKYLRNKLRHLILPVFDEIDSSFRKKATQSINYLNDAKNFIKTETELFMKQNSFVKNNCTYISIAALKNTSLSETQLFFILEHYGFKGDLILNIGKSIKNPVSGKQFFSISHNLLINRDFMIISPLVTTENRLSFEICENSAISCENFELTCEILRKDKNFKLLYKNYVGEFDLDKLQFPLLLRQNQAGDRFIPIGMKGMKKLSDFFIDLKIPVNEKKRYYVLVSGKDIVWIAGLRPDERFKVRENTEKVLRIKWLEQTSG